MSTQTEAERLADLLNENWKYRSDLDTQVAAELRRQNGEIESMRVERIYDIKQIKRLHEANQAMLEALKIAERQLIDLEHEVSGGDDEIYVEGSIIVVRAAISKGEHMTTQAELLNKRGSLLRSALCCR